MLLACRSFPLGSLHVNHSSNQSFQFKTFLPFPPNFFTTTPTKTNQSFHLSPPAWSLENFSDVCHHRRLFSVLCFSQCEINASCLNLFLCHSLSSLLIYRTDQKQLPSFHLFGRRHGRWKNWLTAHESLYTGFTQFHYSVPIR